MAHAALSERHSELCRKTVYSTLATRQKCLLTVPRFAVKTAPLAALMTGSCGQPWDNTHLLWTTVTLRLSTLHPEILSQIQINTNINVFPYRVAHKCMSQSKNQTQGSSESKSFTRTAWGSNKIHNHNHNRQVKPRHLTRLSQLHTPFVPTNNIPHTYLNVILLKLFLVFKADVLDEVSHLNSVWNLKFHIPFTCQLKRSRRCHFHNSGWPV
jgi:hypothetical protein